MRWLVLFLCLALVGCGSSPYDGEYGQFTVRKLEKDDMPFMTEGIESDEYIALPVKSVHRVGFSGEEGLGLMLQFPDDPCVYLIELEEEL